MKKNTLLSKNMARGSRWAGKCKRGALEKGRLDPRGLQLPVRRIRLGYFQDSA
jgi:hypothetical protein